MIRKRWKKLGIVAGLSLSLFAAGCGGGDEEAAGEGSYSEQVDYTITGIEPGAGLMELTNDTVEAYDNLDGWDIQESSGAGMTTALREAIENEEPIVVTLWSPHWAFSAYDLKYLDDPQGTISESEDIHTIVREGLDEDLPNAYAILDNFFWEIEEMEEVMLAAEQTSEEEAAAEWVEENQDRVSEWTEGVEEANGEEFELGTTPWESELASAHVMLEVLTQHGFDVTLTPVDPAVLFQSIASGDVDGSVAPWLPVTHAAIYEEHKEDLVDLGENLTGTQNGLAVPEYMDIDSIEDLEPRP